MSRENVELVRRGFDAFARGDVPGLLEGVSDDLVMYRADPEGVYFHGKEGLLAALADWVEGFDEFSMSTEEFVEAGDWVLVRVRQAARGRDSGVPVEGDYWFVQQVRDGKVVRLDIYVDRDAAFAATGAEG